VVLAVISYDPARVAALHARGGPADRPAARRDLVDAVIRTLAFVGAVVAIRLGVGAYVPRVPTALSIVLATALAADLVAEWRARLRVGELCLVWPEHRPYAIAPAMAALEAAGIDGHARSARQRTMLQFFGPWLPIEILVAPGSADEARRVIARALAPASKDEVDPPAQKSERRRGSRTRARARKVG
jgi:hypothetical protein